jgi:hypothetical protein
VNVKTASTAPGFMTRAISRRAIMVSVKRCSEPALLHVRKFGTVRNCIQPSALRYPHRRKTNYGALSVGKVRISGC